MSNTADSAFLIGITGHMDLRDEEVPRLKRQLRLLFRFLKQGPDQTDPDHPEQTLLQSLREQLPGGPSPTPPTNNSSKPLPNPYAEELRHWPGLSHTPVIVLSSLAPGADTL